MPLNLDLYVEAPASWRQLAETILEREWSDADAEGWPQTQQWAEASRLWVGDSRPMEWDPLITDLGIDYTVVATFILNSERSMYDQVTEAILAAARVCTKFHGRGALLYERDAVILRWDEDGLVANEWSRFKDHAAEVLGTEVPMAPIPWE